MAPKNGQKGVHVIVRNKTNIDRVCVIPQEGFLVRINIEDVEKLDDAVRGGRLKIESADSNAPHGLVGLIGDLISGGLKVERADEHDVFTSRAQQSPTKRQSPAGRALTDRD